jgi:hypothetical protein
MPASTASVGRVFTMVIASLPQGDGGGFRDHGRGEIGGLIAGEFTKGQRNWRTGSQEKSASLWRIQVNLIKI